MRSGFVAVVVATCASCVPAVEPSSYIVGSYYLVVEASPNGLGEIQGWSVGRDRHVTDFERERALYYLSYSRPLNEEGINVLPDSTVTLVRADAAPADALPLPPATHWTRVSARCDDGADTCEVTGRDGLPPELDNVRVVPPSCPSVVLESIGFDGSPAIVSITRFGEQGVLLGRSAECVLQDERKVCIRRLPSGIVHVDPKVSATRGNVLLAPAVTSTSTRDPLFFEEDGQLRVIGGSAEAYAFDVGRDLTFRAPELIRARSGEILSPIAVASRTVAGETTTLMVDYARRLWTRETPSGPFTMVGTAETSTTAEQQCDSGTDSSLLVVTEARQGLVSFRRDPIRTVNLDALPAIGAAYGPGGVTPACRSARYVMDSGDELLTWRGILELPKPRAELWWRRSGVDSWESLRAGELDPVGSAVVAQGDFIFAAVQRIGDVSSSIAVYQRNPARPDLVPRFCGNIETKVVIRVMASTPYGVIAGGLDASPVWIRVMPSEAR